MYTVLSDHPYLQGAGTDQAHVTAEDPATSDDEVALVKRGVRKGAEKIGQGIYTDTFLDEDNIELLSDDHESDEYHEQPGQAQSSGEHERAVVTGRKTCSILSCSKDLPQYFFITYRHDPSTRCLYCRLVSAVRAFFRVNRITPNKAQAIVYEMEYIENWEQHVTVEGLEIPEQTKHDGMFHVVKWTSVK